MKSEAARIIDMCAAKYVFISTTFLTWHAYIKLNYWFIAITLYIITQNQKDLNNTNKIIWIYAMCDLYSLFLLLWVLKGETIILEFLLNLLNMGK